MSWREGALHLTTAAAAFTAAVFFRLAVAPGAIHDPEPAARFADVVEALPALGAVRVRSSDPAAAHRLATEPGAGFVQILDPRRARAAFRYGRLLYAPRERLEEVLRGLQNGVAPARMPPAPDVSSFFHDARGPYACDVVVSGPADLDRIRTVLPDASLLGEPVAREADGRDAAAVTRALIAALVAAAAVAAWRLGTRQAQRRLLAALGGLAVVGVVGLGVDVWTVLALLLVVAAPGPAALLAGAPCLFFPALALRRLGLVLLFGGVLRLGPRLAPGAPSTRPPPAWRRVTLGLLLAATAAVALHRPRARAPEAVAGEPAVALVPPAEVAATIDAFRAAGLGFVSDPTIEIPPPADPPTQSLLLKIHERAKRLAERGPEAERARFQEVADAAGTLSLYAPADLRARMRARDGRAAVWVQGPEPAVDREELASGELYRLRGESGLRRQSCWAALFCLALVATIQPWRNPRRLLLRWTGLAAATALLVVGERAWDMPGVAEASLPLVVLAAHAPSALLLVALAAAVACASAPYLLAAAALAVVTLVSRD